MTPPLTLATFESFIAPTSRSNVQGANVASIDYFHALLRYGAPHIGRLLYIPVSEADKEAFLAQHSQHSTENMPLLEVLSLFSLPQALEEGKIDGFFCSSLLSSFEKTVNYRNRYAPHLPVTALIHSISYAEYAELYARLAVIGLKPYDTLICSSKAGMKVIQKSFQEAEALISRSTETKPSLSCRLEHIPLGVYTENFQTKKKADARKELMFDEDETILLSLGRLSPYDKTDLLPLLRAFRHRTEEKPCKKLRLILAGSRTPNNYPAVLEHFIQLWGLNEKVSLLCDIDNNTKYALYAAADLFISPSDNFQETFGLTLLEAQASGLPVIASDFNGYKELVLHNKTGILIPTLWKEPESELCDLLSLTYENNRHLVLSQGFVVSPGELFFGISQLIDDRQKRETLSQKGKEWAEQFHWRKITSLHTELWNKIIAEGKKHKKETPVVRTPPPETKTHHTPLPFQLSYATLFNHYPTEILTDEHSFTLAKEGEFILGNKTKFSIYADMTEVLNPSLLRQLLFLCRKSPRSYKNIKENVKMKQKELVNKCGYHLLWLAKHHYLDCSFPLTNK